MVSTFDERVAFGIVLSFIRRQIVVLGSKIRGKLMVTNKLKSNNKLMEDQANKA